MVKQSICKPIPINQEVIWDKTKTIVSTTDKFGTIIDVNQTFLDVCGYSIEEVLGQPHNIIRHPDSPQILFKILWENILAGRNFHVILKNISKSGKYYWVITDFEVNRNTEGEIVSFTARRRSVAENVINEHIMPLYETLLKLEKIGGTDLSNRYFKGFLDKQRKSYVEYIMDIVGEDTTANITQIVTDEKESLKTKLCLLKRFLMISLTKKKVKTHDVKTFSLGCFQ